MANVCSEIALREGAGDQDGVWHAKRAGLVLLFLNERKNLLSSRSISLDNLTQPESITQIINIQLVLL